METRVEMEGKFAPELPPPSRISAADWVVLAKKARQRPGKPMLAATNVRYSTIKGLMQRTRPPFVQDDGRIRVNMRNSSLDEDGVRYGDVWMTWEPRKGDE